MTLFQNPKSIGYLKSDRVGFKVFVSDLSTSPEFAAGSTGLLKRITEAENI